MEWVKGFFGFFCHAKFMNIDAFTNNLSRAFMLRRGGCGKAKRDLKPFHSHVAGGSGRR